MNVISALNGTGGTGIRAVFEKTLLLVCLLFIAASASAGMKEAVQAYRTGNFKTAFAEFYPLASQGQAKAQYYLGKMYFFGQGVVKDARQAAMWNRKAAEQGDAGAQTNLGWAYYNGLGVPRDFQQAAVWYRKAAEQNFMLAQNLLGELYETGSGVPQDFHQAAAWYRKADEQEQMQVMPAEESLLQQAQQKFDGGAPEDAFRLYVRAYAEATSIRSRNRAVHGLALTYPALREKPALPEEARRYLAQSTREVADKKYAQALEWCEKALRIAPWWAAGHYDQALIHAAMGARMDEDAKGRELVNQFFGKVHIAGEMGARRGQYAKATASMKNFLQLAPNDEKAPMAQNKIHEWEPNVTYERRMRAKGVSATLPLQDTAE